MNNNKNNNMVKNPETEVPKTPEMNDWDYLNDMLATEKSLGSNYAIVMSEVSNEQLYEEISEIYKQTKDYGRALFNLMFKNGWYKLEHAEQPKITSVAQEYEGKTNQFKQKNG